MLKALFQKQFLEMLGQNLFRDRRTGKARGRGGIILFALLYVVLFLTFAFMFGSIAFSLCAPLVEAGLDWLYFALIALLAVALGVFGSVFNTYAALYRSKDNDLLLSMPIPPSAILLVKLTSIALLAFLFVSLVFLPAVVVYNIVVGVSFPALLFQILLVIPLSAVSTALTCLLGWLVALIAVRVKNKTFWTVALTLVFLAGYYYIYGSAFRILSSLLANVEKVSAVFRSWLFPLYAVGEGALGKPLYFILAVLIAAAAFALTWFILSRTYIRIATDNRGAAKTVYREKRAKVSNVQMALLRREFRRFTSSSVYMLNCGLGIVIMLLAPIAGLIKMGTLRELLGMFFQGDETRALLPLFLTLMICLLATMNDITAPSVSLEGRTLWLVQSLPVRTQDILSAKLRLHVILTAIPVALDALIFCFIAQTSIPEALLVLAAAVAFVLFTAAAGLAINILMPNLNWTNEAFPVKQSPVVLIMIFGAWFVLAILGVLYALLAGILSPLCYLLIVTVVFFLGFLLILLWLQRGGAKRFEALG
ncbi:MAG: hypothetical protein J6V24_03100 [Clostridia bacterium]|nr:hypothetical protein [Clostridia bacterium]